MNAHAVSTDDRIDALEPDGADESPTARRNLRRPVRLVIATFTVVWVCFHIYTAGFGSLSGLQLRAIHVGGALLLVFVFYPVKGRVIGVVLDTLLAVLAVVAVGYVFVGADRIEVTNFFANRGLEMFLGIAFGFVILEAIRRTIGWFFVGFIVLLVGYGLFGAYVPGLFGHAGIPLDRMVYTLYLGPEGIWGNLVRISATLISIFVIFGAVLEFTGGGKTFMRMAVLAAGRFRGGAAQVSAVSSAFLGMINGSAVANVAATGSFTIPLMKRLGYGRNLAGGVESAASTGGQFMPPVMGPGAFLLAELVGVSYLAVVEAALLPSTLYFAGLLFGIYLFARRRSLRAVPAELRPSVRETFAIYDLIVLLVPVGILVWLIVRQLPPQTAAFWAITAMLGFAALRLTSGGLRGIGSRATTTARELAVALERGGKALSFVAVIVLAGQFVVAIVNTTGLGVKLSQLVISVGQDSLLPALVLAMLVAIILGMGMPTPAAYALAAAVLAAPLTTLGVEPLTAHLFLYYFACYAAITPPVGPAVYVAVAMSGGKFLRTAIASLSLSVSLLLVPFAFVMEPALLLDGSPLTVVVTFVSALIGVLLLSVACVGFLRTRLGPPARLLVGISAVALVVPGWHSDVVGLALAAATLLLASRTRGGSTAEEVRLVDVADR